MLPLAVTNAIRSALRYNPRSVIAVCEGGPDVWVTVDLTYREPPIGLVVVAYALREEGTVMLYPKEELVCQHSPIV
jgi:hypothetical protein